jgi:hypothetical protein
MAQVHRSVHRIAPEEDFKKMTKITWLAQTDDRPPARRHNADRLRLLHHEKETG